MTLLIIIIFILIEIILVILLLKLKGTKKNIWQKISFLYNRIYELLILNYYNNNYSLKLDIIDYYNNIVDNKKLDTKYDKWNEFKEFITKYFNNDKKMSDIFKDIEWSVNKDYTIISNAINNIIYTIIIVIIVFIGILYIIK